MSAMLVSRLRESSALKITSAGPRPERKTGPTHCSPHPHPQHFPPEAEPPEQALRESEAPESWQRCRVEGPDAGRGEAFLTEREFTHGRSRS
jgi:hypothetical protein